ncbi:MAG: hypothetical protein AAF658_20560, partial [Myxococcota bacterium]
MTASLDQALAVLKSACPPEVTGVVATLKRAGGAAYVVGGIVRDAVLGLDGADWDIATDLEPSRVAELFSHVV